MSPASAGAYQVEQYIGACLISQNRPKNLKNREFFQNNHHGNVYHHPSQNNNPYANYHQEGWVGGVPLISFANNQRRNVRRTHDFDEPSTNLSRLAVHTQGAPLIVTKSYQHRKNKPQRTDGVQQTKIFENSNHRKQNLHQTNGFTTEAVENSIKNVDAVSVTSDESSGSQNSVEMCLPRIIKPRKRRKKDRKPQHLRLQNQAIDFDYSNSPLDSNNANLPHFSNFIPNIAQNSVIDCKTKRVPEAPYPVFDIFNEISETPKLHHNFEDVQEDLNGNQPSITCQCRYCDPSGHNIWDVDRSCYSPFLTPPKVFDFGNLESVLANIASGFDGHCLDDDIPKRRSSFSRSWSGSSGSSDLEVSTEIVTSLNGHRDLEIKFFNPSLLENKNNKDKDTVSSTRNNSQSENSDFFGSNNYFSSLVSNANEKVNNSARCDQDGLCEQNTSFFSNGTISF